MTLFCVGNENIVYYFFISFMDNTNEILYALLSN
jgi:hypothetical protein